MSPTPRETYNKIITTVNSITPDYEFIPDLNNCIVIDTSNNRIGINTLKPDENIHVSGGKIKCSNLIVLNDLSTNNIASDLIPKDDLSYNLGSIDYAWHDLYLGPSSFYMDKRKIIHIVKDLSLLVIDNSYYSLDISDVNHLSIRCDVSFNRSIEVTKDASVNGILDVCGDLLLTNKSGISTIYTPGILIIDPSIHNDKSGDVIIKGNLDVKGTTTYINSTIVEISDNVIQLNANHSYVSEGGIQIRTFSNADVSFCFNNDNQEWTTHDNDLHIGGNLGVGINNPTVSLDISSTNALKIPVGRTLERPYSNDENIHAGYIRYNIEQHTYEGFGAGNAWGTLGGVKDVDQDTYIIAESSAGVDNDDLQFYTAGVQRLEISNTGDFSLNANNVFINSANSLDLSATTIISISPEIKTNKIYANTFDGTFGYFANIVTNGINATGLITSYGGINVYGGMNLQNKDITSVNRITANTFSGGTYSSGSINGSVTIGSRTATDINTAITNNANAISANTGNITNNANAISTNATNITNLQNNLTNGSIVPNSATKLQTARTIAGVSFNGTGNINIPYSNLTGLPTIPSNNNQLTNGAGYITGISNLANIGDVPALSASKYLKVNSSANGLEWADSVPSSFSCSQITGNGSHTPNNNNQFNATDFSAKLRFINNVTFDNPVFFTGIGGTNHSGATNSNNSIFASYGISSGGTPWSHSDDRLKHNEVNISNGLNIVRQLQPKYYDRSWNMNESDSSKYFKEAGLIAQDVLAINDISFAVRGGDFTDASGVYTESPYSLKYADLLIYHMAATKELDEEVQKLTKENKIFKSTLNSLLLDLGREPISL